MSSSLALSSSGKRKWNGLLARIVSTREQHSADIWQSMGVIAKMKYSIFIASIQETILERSSLLLL
jgi:hypothetical protein